MHDIIIMIHPKERVVQKARNLYQVPPYIVHTLINAHLNSSPFSNIPLFLLWYTSLARSTLVGSFSRAR